VEIMGQIIGFIFAAFLLRLAYKFFKKEKYPTCTLLSGIGAFIMVCSFPWFQGWAKAYFGSVINSKLEALGQQVNTVQDTTTEMHKQLADHQAQIDNHQKELGRIQAKIGEAESNVVNQQSEITNQYQRISVLQSNLGTAQTTILDQQDTLNKQQQKLGDVEYLVQNLFENTTNEAFSALDTNHVWFLKEADGGIRYEVRLSNMPIHGSVHCYAKPGFGEGANVLQIIGRSTEQSMMKNLCSYRLYGYPPETTVFTFEYVVDKRETSFLRRMPSGDSFIIRGNETELVNPSRFY
jgi:hypothetical protein